MKELYAFDSNVYIVALRSRTDLEELKEFLRRAGGRVVVSAVVAMELRAGAATVEQQADVDALIGEYRRRQAVITPSFEAYAHAGRVLSALRVGRRSGDVPASFIADAIIASSCREVGVTLITRNFGDFSRLQRQLRGFRFSAPWPNPGSARR